MKKRLFKILCILLTFIILPLPTVYAVSIPSVTASTAIAMDYDTGEILYAKDIDTLRVPASMTKIMTAYIIYEEMASGNLTKDTQIPVSATAASMSRNSNYPMPVPLTSGAAYSVDTLLKLIMIPSASASCYAMAEYISGSEEAFVKKMNETAATLGINASFTNCHGAQTHYITARGVATLIRNFIQKYPDILNYTSMTSVAFNGVTYNNTNKLLSTYYCEGADGFKTGTIASAGYCLSATAVRNGKRVITVVMNSSSNDTRHTDSQKILNYGFEEIAARDASRKSTLITVKSAPDSVRLNTDFGVTVSLSGVSAEYEALGGGWKLNGETSELFGAFTVKNGLNLNFDRLYVPANYSDDTVTICFYINHTDGTKMEYELEVPISSKEAALFRDVDRHWAEEQIGYLTDFELVTGDGNGYFRPKDGVTRAEFVTILAKYAQNSDIDTTYSKEAPFTDVPPSRWYYANVAWAAEAGIMNGYGNGTFGPSDLISREQMAVMLYQYFKIYEEADNGPAAEIGLFTDEKEISRWAFEAVIDITERSLLSGYEDGTFRPAKFATRAEAAAIFYRCLKSA